MLGLTELIVCLIAGAVASLTHFGGLWWTVKRLTVAPNPLSIYLVSFILRMATIAMGVFVIVQLGWQQLLAALVGFLVVRYTMTIVLGVPTVSVMPTQTRSQP